MKKHITPLLLGTILLLAGCMSLYESRRSQSSSVAEYLFPGEIELAERERLPRLELPLRAGVAFVPDDRPHRATLPPEEREALARSVAEAFEGLPFVDSITVVPTNYLRPGGSFGNLDQIRRMFGVDIIVLLGYDQMQVIESTTASLAVWTIVGAYIVPSERSGTHTLMEAVVYEIPSRSLLFRAPGTNTTGSRYSTAQGQERRLRVDSVSGFNGATESLIDNLHVSLADFEQRVRDRPDDYEIVRRPGYSGGAGLPLAGIAAGALLLLGGLYQTHVKGRAL
ncbi:MAG: rhombotarget lipoprotein [Opitutales bacterium]|nr:rhombotarget lipoprotein [Opitutales bacterium]